MYITRQRPDLDGIAAFGPIETRVASSIITPRRLTRAEAQQERSSPSSAITWYSASITWETWGEGGGVLVVLSDLLQVTVMRDSSMIPTYGFHRIEVLCITLDDGLKLGWDLHPDGRHC